MKFGMRELVFVLVLLGVPVASYFFVFGPRNTQIAEAREEIQQKQAKLRELDNYTRNRADLGKEIDKLKVALEMFERRLPAQREVDVILKEVTEVAARHRLMLKNIRTDKPLPAAQYTELPIRLVIDGDADDFYKFLCDLDKMQRIARMKRIKLTKATAGSEGQVEADLILSIFYDSGDAAAQADAFGRSRT